MKISNAFVSFLYLFYFFLEMLFYNNKDKIKKLLYCGY